MVSSVVLASLLLFAQAGLALPPHGFKAYDAALKARQAGSNATSLQVDLGYEIYDGVKNASTGLNVWKGYIFEEASLQHI